MKSKIRSKEFFHISPFGKTSKITESSLLDVIRTMGATRIEIEKVEPWSVTNAFFQDSTVKKAWKIYLQNVKHNGITDDTLASLSLGKDTVQLELGHTPALTIAGLRRFLQPVMEGKAKQRIIKFVPSFTVSSPRDLFSDLKAIQNPADSAFWTIQRPSERDISFSNTNFQGVKSIWMTVKT